MQQLTATVLAILIASSAAGGCNGDDSEGAAAAPRNCEEVIDAYIDRVSECRMVDEQERQSAVARCEAADRPADPRAAWRPEFARAFEECAAGLSCEAFVEDSDDICFPPALADGSAGLLAAATIDACVLGGSSDCENHLAAGGEPGSSVVARCLRRWLECADAIVDTEPYWTEDHCTTIVALTDEHRMTADPCLARACGDVAGCLVAAGAFGF